MGPGAAGASGRRGVRASTSDCAPAASRVGKSDAPGARSSPGGRASKPPASKSTPTGGRERREAELPSHLVALGGEDRPDELRQRAEDREERAEDGLDATAASLLVFGPRGGAVDVLIRGRRDRPRALEGPVGLDRVPRFERGAGMPLRDLEQVLLERGRLAGRRHLPAGHLGAEAERPSEEVAEVLAEVGVVSLDHGGEVEVAVLPERDGAEELVAEHVGAGRVAASDGAPEGVGDRDGVDRVAERLAHLLPAEREKTVREHGRREPDPRAHEERRPVDGVEADDVLADEMDHGAVVPELLELRVALQHPTSNS